MEPNYNNPKKQETIKKRQLGYKEKFLEELKKIPIISVAAKRAGISRATVYRWQDEPEFRETINGAQREGNALINDMAESQLIKKIQDGSFPASKYWLEHHHPAYKKVSPWGGQRTSGEEKSITELVADLEETGGSQDGKNKRL